jgi:hypothetical protein
MKLLWPIVVGIAWYWGDGLGVVTFAASLMAMRHG